MVQRMVVAVDLSQEVEEAFTDVVRFIPRMLGFLAILVVGYLVAKAVAKAADAVLERTGFDRAVERGGINRALSGSHLDASDVVGKVIFYALFLLVLQLALAIFGPNPVSDLIAGVVAYLPRVAVAIIIVVVFAAVAAGVRTLIQTSLGGLGYGGPLAHGVSAAIVVVGVFAALDQLAIAPVVVNGVFYGLLAIVVGSAIVAVGGGGIQPMRSRWERALTRIEEEAPEARRHLRARAERAPVPVAAASSAGVRRSQPPQSDEAPALADVTDVTDDENEVVVVEIEPEPSAERIILPRPTPRGRRATGSREPLRTRRPAPDPEQP